MRNQGYRRLNFIKFPVVFINTSGREHKMRIKILVLMICCSFLVVPDAYAVSKRKLNDRIERANNYLEDVMEIPDTRIPTALL
jgi:hypothetical protein